MVVSVCFCFLCCCLHDVGFMVVSLWYSLACGDITSMGLGVGCLEGHSFSDNMFGMRAGVGYIDLVVGRC